MGRYGLKFYGAGDKCRWHELRRPGASAEDVLFCSLAVFDPRVSHTMDTKIGEVLIRPGGLGEGLYKLHKWVRAKPRIKNSSGEFRRGFFGF